MTRVPLDADEAFSEEAPSTGEERKTEGPRRPRTEAVDVEIEREVTKRHLIEAITSIVVIVLYMAFTLIREREPGVVALDDDSGDGGAEDDWKEA